MQFFLQILTTFLKGLWSLDWVNLRPAPLPFKLRVLHGLLVSLVFSLPAWPPRSSRGDTGNAKLPTIPHKHKETTADGLRNFDTDSIKQRFNPSELDITLGHSDPWYATVFSWHFIGVINQHFPDVRCAHSEILSDSGFIQFNIQHTIWLLLVQFNGLMVGMAYGTARYKTVRKSSRVDMYSHYRANHTDRHPFTITLSLRVGTYPVIGLYIVRKITPGLVNRLNHITSFLCKNAW